MAQAELQALEPGAAEPSTGVLAFDLGATWFRSAVVDGGRLGGIRRVPALGRAADPRASVGELEWRLVDHILDEVARRRAQSDGEPPATVGISLGAAVHGRSGLVLASAPLWGPGAAPFDLAAALRSAEPACRWVVLNDVSAAALAFATMSWAADRRKLAAVTLSTGIALRTVEVATGRIAADRGHGLQGEIGHVPVEVQVGGRQLSLPCDCGAHDHLSAFLSGRGIARVLAVTGHLNERDDPLAAFAAAVRSGDRDSLALLDALAMPLARILLDLAVLDPECELVVLYGGVARGLGEPLRRSVVRNLAGLGLYGVSDRDPDFFERRIRLVDGDDFGLLGAARAAALREEANLASRGGRAWRVAAKRQVSYAVRMVDGLLEPGNPALAATVAPRATRATSVVVVDSSVARFHGERIRRYFEESGLAIRLVELAGGETSKSVDQVTRLIAEFGVAAVPRRGAPIVAIGGGVTLDVVGLSASLFRRGTPFVRVPTTLVGLIDAGIGAKTAVNLHGHKSWIGTYHPGTAALLDLAFLATLDRREIRNGLAEAVKIAVVKDAQLFDEIVLHGRALLDDPASAPGTPAIVRRSVGAMLEELASNLWEDCLERLPDFGHSFSPAIEMRARPQLLHGEAVAIDMALSALIARNRGLLAPYDAQQLLAVLDLCELPRWHPNCTSELAAAALAETTRHRDGLQRVPLLTGIGSATFVNDITQSEIDAAIAELGDSTPTPAN
jgi:3-dehydroquinate synthetase/predicted NBD/HSP70 family sugar kinase